MKTDNELIAEFMGWEKVYVGYFGGEDETDWQRNKQHQKWMKDVELDMVGDYIVNVAEDKWEFWEDVAYDTSWDWLMPVVEKIRNKYQLWCQTKRFKEMDPIFRKLQNELIFCSIQGTHEWCVEFIKWYNDQRGNK